MISCVFLCLTRIFIRNHSCIARYTLRQRINLQWKYSTGYTTFLFSRCVYNTEMTKKMPMWEWEVHGKFKAMSGSVVHRSCRFRLPNLVFIFDFIICNRFWLYIKRGQKLCATLLLLITLTCLTANSTLHFNWNPPNSTHFSILLNKDIHYFHL